MCKKLRCGKCLISLCFINLIINIGIQNIRNKSGTDSLDRMWPFLTTGEHRRGIRFNGNHLQPGLSGLEHFAHTGNRAPGSNSRDENIDLAVGIAPDFLGRRRPVNCRVGRVLELLRDEVARVGRRHFVGAANRPGHALGARRQPEFYDGGRREMMERVVEANPAITGADCSGAAKSGRSRPLRKFDLT